MHIESGMSESNQNAMPLERTAYYVFSVVHVNIETTTNNMLPRYYTPAACCLGSTSEKKRLGNLHLDSPG